jgi:L-alanine-DL-glutamate epimerase-like enolase superfamily enzyme
VKLERAHLELLTLTLRRPLRTARGEVRTREGQVLVLRAGGLTGRGEATVHPFSPREAVTASEAALAGAAKALVGQGLPGSLVEVERMIGALAALAEAPSARHAVESALLDLLAQARGCSVAALLCGAPRPVVEVNALLAESTPAALAAEAARAAASGFRTLKLKVGLPDDEARVGAVRAAVGPGIRLRVDANGAWTVEAAREALARLSPYGLELCEQPVAAADRAGLGALRGQVGCAVAADEAATTEAEVRALVPHGERASVDALVLRPMVLGGLLPALRAAEWAHERGVGAYVACGLDGIVARAAAAQLAACLPGDAAWAHGLGVGALLEDEPVVHPHAPVEGRIALPAAAGLGLEVGR